MGKGVNNVFYSGEVVPIKVEQHISVGDCSCRKDMIWWENKLKPTATSNIAEKIAEYLVDKGLIKIESYFDSDPDGLVIVFRGSVNVAETFDYNAIRFHLPGRINKE